MATVVIGIAGEKRAGKGTFVNMLARLHPVEVASSHRILAETAKALGLQETRKNLMLVSNTLKDIYGPDTLSGAMYKKISGLSGKVKIYDCIRWESDLKTVQLFPHNLLVYITAESEVRFERSRLLALEKKEEPLTYKEFCDQDQMPTERQISEIGQQSSFYRIQNNRTALSFHIEVANFYNLKVRPILEGHITGNP
ncbi:hypothetical protein KW791_01245 [Candidatus Parcubacteria bacterium]|nr:hypothetical protein [Candidatus Parcubacteria bacterium]